MPEHSFDASALLEDVNLLAETELWETLEKEAASDAYRAVAELRKRRSHFMMKPVVHALFPRCENCYGREQHRLEWESWRVPDINPHTWRRDLRRFGVPPKEIERLEDTDYDAFFLKCRECEIAASRD